MHTLETDLVYVRFLVTRLGSEKHTFEAFPHIRHLQPQREGKLHTSIGIGIDGQRSRRSRSSLYEHTELGSSSSVCVDWVVGRVEESVKETEVSATMSSGPWTFYA